MRTVHPCLTHAPRRRRDRLANDESGRSIEKLYLLIIGDMPVICAAMGKDSRASTGLHPSPILRLSERNIGDYDSLIGIRHARLLDQFKECRANDCRELTRSNYYSIN